MRVLFVNTVCGIGSTGKICCELAENYTKDGHLCKIAYGRGVVPSKYDKYAYRIGNVFDIYFHVFVTRMFDKHGLASKKATYNFIKWADEFNPDVLWLHNIHGYYINYEILFTWIKTRPLMKVKWTLHDCWAFTGHCAHYISINCDKWIYKNKKNNCIKCPQLKEYPKSILFNCSNQNYKRKKSAFTNVKDLEIFTPSEWLRDEIGKSFLKNYKVTIKRNVIDNNVFNYINNNIKEEYNIFNKKLLLGVSNVWSNKKGLNDFLKLATMLGQNYVLMIVGVNKKISKYIKSELKCYYDSIRDYGLENPKSKFESLNYEYKLVGNRCVEKNVNAVFRELTGKEYNDKISPVYKIILIPNISSGEDLAKIYSASDCFLNLTYEDTYPTVNLEAIACKTKVITYDVGGCKETIIDYLI